MSKKVKTINVPYEYEPFGFQEAINYDKLDNLTGDALNELAEIFQLEENEISEIADKLNSIEVENEK